MTAYKKNGIVAAKKNFCTLLRYIISMIKAHFSQSYQFCTAQPYFHCGSTALSATFNVPLFVPLLYFIRGRFVNFRTRGNKSLHKVMLVKTACPTAASFQVFLCQSQFISLLIRMLLTFLLSLLSAIVTVVAFRHLATKSSFYSACFYLLFLL